MNVIVTASSMDKIAELEEPLNESSMVFILYEPEEQILLSQIALIHDSNAKIVFLQVASRDDKLLCIGGIKVRMDCTILDEELQCSSAFLDKINGVFSQGRLENPKAASGLPNFASRMAANSSQKTSVSKQSTPKQSIQQVREASKVQSQSAEKEYIPWQKLNLSKSSQALYQLIQLSAPDVGFTYGTDSLMKAIMSVVRRNADDVDALKSAVLEMNNGDLIWKQMEPKLEDIRQLVLSGA